MGEYRPIEIKFNSEIKCTFAEYNEDYCTVLIADFDGKMGAGSNGSPDAKFMYHKLAENVIYIFPYTILLDFRDLQYEYGNSILKVFEVVEDITFGDTEHLIPIVLLVSDKCIYGLSSLIGFNMADLPEWIFTDYDKALEYAVKKAKEYGEL